MVGSAGLIVAAGVLKALAGLHIASGVGSTTGEAPTMCPPAAAMFLDLGFGAAAFEDGGRS
jgi:hypothetical protein